MLSADFPSGYRYYSQAFNANHSAPAFQYLRDNSLTFSDPAGNQYTGGWRPIFPSDLAANVSISGGISVGNVHETGLVTVTVTNANLNVFDANSYAALTSGDSTLLSILARLTSGSVVTGGSVSASIPNPIGVLVSGGSLNVALTGVGITASSTTLVTGGYLGLTGVVSVTVGNTSPIPVSGVVQAQVSIGAVGITGVVNTTGTVQIGNTNPINVSGNLTIPGNVYAADPIARALLSGISGALTSSLTDAANVTGNVGITGVVQTNDFNGNTFLAYISGKLDRLTITGGSIQTIVTGGSVSASVPNPLGVTGTKTDLNPSIFGAPAVPYTLLPVGGRCVAATGAGSVTGGYQTGDYAMLTINPANGALYTNQGILDPTQDGVNTVVSGNATVSNDAISGVPQVVIAANPNRLSFFIQNLSTGVLLCRYSSSLPTLSNFNFSLKGASSMTGADGGNFSSEPCTYRGPISVTGYGGSPVLYTAWSI